jgi:FxsC-like protein
VFIAIASPAYFKSEYCGKEWGLFRQRLLNAANGQPLPPLLKPIVWISIRNILDSLPPEVSAGQANFGRGQDVQNVRGFQFLLKNVQANQVLLNTLVEDLADEIVDASDKYAAGAALPRLPHVPALRDVVPLFPAAAAGAPQPVGGAAVAVSPTGPKHVRFVYIAANPTKLAGARAPDPYVESGGSDWKPYFPTDKRRVHVIAQNTVSDEALDFTSEEMPFGPNLIAEIEDAWRKRQIVVVIIDGWTLQWDGQAKAMLAQLDDRLDSHWCVLVPENPDDRDETTARAAIDAAIAQNFGKHVSLGNPLFFRNHIQSVEDLKANLRDVVTRLKEEIKKRAEVTMPLPAGPSRTVISGPSART